MNKFDNIVESVLTEKKKEYELDVNGDIYKAKLDLSNEKDSIAKILSAVKNSNIGSGHEGKDLTVYKNGNGRLELLRYYGGPTDYVDITLVEEILVSEKIQADGTATSLTDLWKLDGPEDVSVFDTFWTRMWGDLSLFNKAVTFHRASRILRKYKVGDKIKPAEKQELLSSIALDSAIQKNLKKYNAKLASNISKNKQVKEYIAENLRSARQSQIDDAITQEEKIALRRFFNEYGSKMDNVYDIYHTYADLTQLKDSSNEYISVKNRASVFSTKYIGEVNGGPFTMKFTEENPIIITDVQGI